MSNQWQSARQADISFNWKDCKEGFEVIGYYMNLQTGKGQEGNSNIYTFKDKETKEDTSFWGSHVLDDQFGGVALGTMCKIVYGGLVKGKGGKSYHSYELFFNDADKYDLGEAAGVPASNNTVQATAPQQATNEDPDDLPF